VETCPCKVPEVRRRCIFIASDGYLLARRVVRRYAAAFIGHFGSLFCRADYNRAMAGSILGANGVRSLDVSCWVCHPPVTTQKRWFASGLSGSPRITQGWKPSQGVAAINPVMHQEASEEGVHLVLRERRPGNAVATRLNLLSVDEYRRPLALALPFAPRDFGTSRWQLCGTS
jgi:hypothetical protein